MDPRALQHDLRRAPSGRATDQAVLRGHRCVGALWQAVYAQAGARVIAPLVETRAIISMAPRIFILAEILYCSGRNHYHHRPQTDVGTANSTVGRPAPAAERAGGLVLQVIAVLVIVEVW